MLELYKFEALSSMMVGKLVSVHELMLVEVQQRQKDWTSNHKDVAELLLSDLERIVKAVRERNANECDDAEDLQSQDETDEQDEKDDAEVDGEGNADGYGSRLTKRVRIKHEPANDDDITMQADVMEQNNHAVTGGGMPAWNSGLEKKAQIASLRADAMRLKQAVAGRMAEAYELEADVLREEAKQDS